jgi:hypothetical protein
VSIWHVGGLGAKFRFDPTVECLWYAYSHYLRMEDVVVAYVLLEQSRSHSGYIERVMETLKANILVRDGALVDTEHYWVLAFTSRLQMVRQIALANPELGTGLCTSLFALIEKTIHFGMPCVKYDAVSCVPPPQWSGTSGRGAERCLVNKRWIANVTTPAEAAIIRVLCRLSRGDNGVRVFPDHDTEDLFVFDTTVRGSFVNPPLPHPDETHDTGKEPAAAAAGAAAYPELAAFAPCVVKNAFCTLLERCGSDGIPLIQRPNDITVAMYRPKETHGVVPSLVHADRYKIRFTVSVPLVVNPVLWRMPATKNRAAVSAFIKKALLIAGGYEGRRVSAGLGDASHRKRGFGSALNDDDDADDDDDTDTDDDTDDDTDADDSLGLHHFVVEQNQKCSVIIRNPHFNGAREILGDAAAKERVDGQQDRQHDDDGGTRSRTEAPFRRVLGDDALFPSDAKEILFTEAERFEANVAKSARARVPLSQSKTAIFDTAYDTF